jgi:hypothetical protein
MGAFVSLDSSSLTVMVSSTRAASVQLSARPVIKMVRYDCPVSKKVLALQPLAGGADAKDQYGRNGVSTLQADLKLSMHARQVCICSTAPRESPVHDRRNPTIEHSPGPTQTLLR